MAGTRSGKCRMSGGTAVRSTTGKRRLRRRHDAPELLLASLGSCAAFYAAMYLKKHKLSTEGTRVQVSAEKAKAPARMENFRITVEVEAGFNDDHKRGIEEAVHHCLIHNTLLNPPKIRLNVQSVALAKS